MRIVLISDTHEQNLRTKWKIPLGDVLVHAGDITARGHPESLGKVAREMADQPHRFKLFVPGNHDKIFAKQRKLGVSIMAHYGIITLIDEAITLPHPNHKHGVTFYGTPWQQVSVEDIQILRDVGYDSFSVLDASEYYKRIPWDDVDCLITHQPPAGILSVSNHGYELGSPQISNHYNAGYGKLPALHVFGHVHERHGFLYEGPTTFVNAALCDPVNRPAFQPVAVDLDPKGWNAWVVKDEELSFPREVDIATTE